jgi:hypothetical protein
MDAPQSFEPDHLILGCKHLDEGIEHMEKLSGYRAAIGGSHPGRGTRNALLAPDPAQPRLAWHPELATLDRPLLVGWAVAVKNIEQYAQHLRQRGVACIGPTPGSRTRPNGDTLAWKTLLPEDDKAGILPFYIEWAADSQHPSTDAPGACLLSRMNRTGEVIEAAAPGPGFQVMSRPDLPSAQLHAFIEAQFGEFELKTRAITSEVWSKQQSR